MKFSHLSFGLANARSDTFVRPRRFGRSSGPIPTWQQRLFLLYRLGVIAYWCYWVIRDALEEPDKKTYIAFLTRWNNISCGLFFILACVLTINANTSAFFRGTSGPGPDADRTADVEEPASSTEVLVVTEGDPCLQSAIHVEAALRRLPWAYQCLWLLRTVSADMSLLVVVAFWLSVATGNTPGYHDNPYSAVNVNVHGAILPVVLLDIAVSAIPYRLTHVVYAIAYGLCYSLFTVVYWAFGGWGGGGVRYIYKPIDYSGLGGVGYARQRHPPGSQKWALFALVPLVLWRGS